MKLQCHLMVSKSGNIRVTKGNVGAKPNELAIRVNLDIPDAFFVRPVPVVDIQIDDVRTVSTEAVVRKAADEVAKSLGIDAALVEDGLLTAMRAGEGVSDG
jgi:hypothetical protein